jgi:hypothetical protein
MKDISTAILITLSILTGIIAVAFTIPMFLLFYRMIEIINTIK